MGKKSVTSTLRRSRDRKREQIRYIVTVTPVLPLPYGRGFESGSPVLSRLYPLEPVILHKGIASRRTRSRISGSRAPSSATSTLQPSSASKSKSSPPGNHGGV